MNGMRPFSSIEALFSGCETAQEKHEKIIDLGRELPPFPEERKRPENLVSGCQSLVYLISEMRENALYFQVTSDALISAGLAALLLKAYNGKPPAFILKYKPTFLESFQIHASLSPGRSNGLASIYLAMQKAALQALHPG